ncbi:ThiF family adenylyltransferase [Fictibacillus nanhaiensis]|uniref:HesA/MoeB/ThiF family protein n=1 Tax=Fictibacillus nanhaiensis TaxID=742169 RepID=UPI001C95D84C|nr:ThiF family adenylyltransferase [Fictibacillus nanhaiensis]MBY6037230.1 ThiF family adenylyltransferase [Fictibacillus nanhaiensis]
MILQFKPYTRVTLNKIKKEVLINRPLTDGNVGQVFELTDVGLEVLESIGELTYEELIAKIDNKYPNSIDEIKEIVDFLFEEKYIEVKGKVTLDPSLSLFSRIIPMWAELESDGVDRNEIQRRIMSKKIAVIGCGTIGSSVVAKLTAMGVKNFVLVDNDVVEETNLTRQPLFSLNDIGQKKTNVLKRYVEDRIRDAIISTYEIHVENTSDMQMLDDADLIISGGDGPGFDKLINEYAVQNQKAVCYAGAYNGHNCKVLPIYVPGKSHDIDCIYHFVKADAEFNGETKNKNDFVVSTVPYIGELIGSIATAEIIKYLTGQVEPYLMNKVLLVNIAKYSIDVLEVPEKYDACTCSLAKAMSR